MPWCSPLCLDSSGSCRCLDGSWEQGLVPLAVHLLPHQEALAAIEEALTQATAPLLVCWQPARSERSILID